MSKKKTDPFKDKIEPIFFDDDRWTDLDQKDVEEKPTSEMKLNSDIVDGKEHQQPFSVVENSEEKNSYGNIFHRFFFFSETISFSFYTCDICDKMFTSRNSIYQHNHINANIIQPSRLIARNNVQLVLKSLLDFICISNISFNQIENSSFINFCKSLNPNVEIPGRTKLHEELLEYAFNIRKENLLSCKYQYLYLLIDGAKKFHHTYEAAIVVSNSKIFFWALQEIPTADAEELARFVEMFNDLVFDIPCRLICIVSDNASNNIAAFNPSGKLAQEFHIYVARFACLCHTLDLSIGKIFHSGAYLIAKTYLDVILQFVLQYCTGENHKIKNLNDVSVMPNPPELTERWNSYSDCSEYVYNHWNDIRIAYAKLKHDLTKQHSDQIGKAINYFIHIIPIRTFSGCLKVIWEAIHAIEGDYFMLGDVWRIIFESYNKFKNFVTDDKSEEQNFVNTIRYWFQEEVNEKGDAGFLQFAKSLILDGLQDLRNEFSKQQDREQFYILIEQTINEFCLSTDQLSFAETAFQEFHSYFEKGAPIESTSDSEGRSILLKDFDYWIHFHHKDPHNPLGILAIQILGIPCSESAVERLFASLGAFYNKETKGSHLETINARLTVKTNHLFKRVSPPQHQTTREVVLYYSNVTKIKQYYKEHVN